MDGLFNLFVVAPLVVWGILVMFPRRTFTTRLVQSPWPFIVLGALTAVPLIGALLASGLPGLTLSGVAALLGSPWGALLAVADGATLTLFVGVWIFRDARYWALPAAPFVIATLLLGPLGLTAYLVVRWRKNRQGPVRIVN